jgi:hypothetical protein
MREAAESAKLEPFWAWMAEGANVATATPMAQAILIM